MKTVLSLPQKTVFAGSRGTPVRRTPSDVPMNALTIASDMTTMRAPPDCHVGRERLRRFAVAIELPGECRAALDRTTTAERKLAIGAVDFALFGDGATVVQILRVGSQRETEWRDHVVDATAFEIHAPALVEHDEQRSAATHECHDRALLIIRVRLGGHAQVQQPRAP